MFLCSISTQLFHIPSKKSQQSQKTTTKKQLWSADLKKTLKSSKHCLFLQAGHGKLIPWYYPWLDGKVQDKMTYYS